MEANKKSGTKKCSRSEEGPLKGEMLKRIDNFIDLHIHEQKITRKEGITKTSMNYIYSNIR